MLQSVFLEPETSNPKVLIDNDSNWEIDMSKSIYYIDCIQLKGGGFIFIK